MLKLAPPAALLALALGALPVQAEPAADALFWGGPIHTGAQASPTAQAVAVKDGRIVFVGDRAGAEALRGAETQVVDLGGAALFPGFVDGHAHLRGIGERELTLNLEGSVSAAQAMERLAEHLKTAPAEGTVVGRGWIETGWPEGRFLNRQDLDAVAPDRPVLLIRADGHALVANSAALAAAGIDATTTAPEGGEILKDEDGAPTGMLIDNAMGLAAKLNTRPSEAQKLAAYRAAFAVETRYGWTGVHNMSVDFADVPLLEAMAAQGQAPMRVYNAVDLESAGPLLKSGPRPGSDGRIVTRAGERVKLRPKEYDVLAYLARNAGKVLGHVDLLKTVWGAGHLHDVQYLRVVIGQLRHKLEKDPAQPALLVTEPGIGYRLAT